MKTFSEWIDFLAHLSTQALLAIFTVLVALLVLQLINRGIGRLERLHHLSGTMAVRVRSMVRWLVLGGVALIVMQQTGLFHQAWAVLSAVLATIAVGFVATWSVLSNATCAGVVLVFRPFRVGDEIELVDTDGDLVMQGRVVDLNLMYTTLRQDADAAVRIPNNMFLQKLVRVRRDGVAPNPARDSLVTFFDADEQKALETVRVSPSQQ